MSSGCGVGLVGGTGASWTVVQESVRHLYRAQRVTDCQKLLSAEASQSSARHVPMQHGDYCPSKP